MLKIVLAGEVGNKEWRDDLRKHPADYLPDGQDELLQHQRDILLINARNDASAAFAMAGFVHSRLGFAITLQVVTLLVVLFT